MSCTPRIAATCFCLLLLSHVAFGGQVTVPGMYPTVQAALDAAAEGDEIVVAPGVYPESIQFKGKSVVLRSTDPADPEVVASTVLEGQGGSVVTFGGAETPACVLAGLTITNGFAFAGAGIRGYGTQATILGNRIVDNYVPYYRTGLGGGVHGCNGLIESNVVEGNFSNGRGGGLAACDGLIRNNVIRNNKALHGGGLFLCNGTIEHNEITDNLAKASGYGFSAGGGGLYQCGGTIQSNLIARNGETVGGGLSDCDGVIRGNTIEENWAYDWYSGGAGLALCDGLIEANTIRANWAESRGGGLSQCHGTIQNNVVWSNWAGPLDGSAWTGYGGGLAECNATIQNNTIHGNTATAGGGGLFSCIGDIRNSIIWANSPSPLEQCSTPQFSCVDGGSAGATIQSGDPGFVNPAGGDFHLTADSPCVDAGCAVEGLAADFEGDLRPTKAAPEPRGDGSAFDIGADELAQVNRPPVAAAGGPYAAPATSWSGATVRLDGSASGDPDGDALTYAWDLNLAVDSDGDGDPANDVDSTDAQPQAVFATGETLVALVVTDEHGLAGDPALATVSVTTLAVAVDVRPGVSPNVINLKSNGVVPVAFLTDATFDAATIDPLTITVRGGDLTNGLVRMVGRKDPKPVASLEDVDADGDLDLVVHLAIQRLAAVPIVGPVVELGALTVDGRLAVGSDTVVLVPR